MMNTHLEGLASSSKNGEPITSTLKLCKGPQFNQFNSIVAKVNIDPCKCP